MSTDTMYINSSRLLPTRSKNKTSNAMFPRSNSNTSVKNSNNNNKNKNNSGSNSGNNNNNKNGNRTNNKRHSQKVNNNSTNSSNSLPSSSEKSKKLDSLKIPLPQTLPNGEKPNFGSSNSNLDSNTKRRNSHNNKDKTTKDLTKNLKNLLLDNKSGNYKKSSNKRSNSKSPKQSLKNVTSNNNNNSISVNSLKNQNTTPIMTFLTSPINGPGSIPNMNLSDHNISTPSNSSSSTGNTPTPTASQMPRVGSQILTRPGINSGAFNPNNNPGPPQSAQQHYPQGFLQQPQRLQSQPPIQAQFAQQQQQQQQQYGLPVGQHVQPMQNMPSNIQQQQQMSMGNVNPGGPMSQHFQSLGYPFALNNNYRLSSVDGPLMPQQIQLMTPMFNQQNGSQPHLQNNNNNNMNIQQRQNTISPNVTPMSMQPTQISRKPQQTNKVQPLSSSSNSSAKRNKARTTTHTFAGASFATDVPQESNLPKPSFL
ncbi:hypothetical protein C6P45_001867 [Maudiozyma exigua]|uniref:Enhancer of mRNA-decapping protein 1 n=1 Tax=Maudiozyma exigua TaxID=34358 RepID=A0A9P6VYB2_MAUEX|nr:hypothetical protein C6P45_001867 [Kazachstania exigua]